MKTALVLGTLVLGMNMASANPELMRLKSDFISSTTQSTQDINPTDALPLFLVTGDYNPPLNASYYIHRLNIAAWGNAFYLVSGILEFGGIGLAFEGQLYPSEQYPNQYLGTGILKVDYSDGTHCTYPMGFNFVQVQGGLNLAHYGTPQVYTQLPAGYYGCPPQPAPSQWFYSGGLYTPAFPTP